MGPSKRMWYKYIAILLLFLNACAECDFYAGGVCIYTQGLEVSQYEIERVTTLMQETLEEDFVKVPKLKKLFSKGGVIATFTEEDLMTDCKKKQDPVSTCRNISGIIMDNKEILVEWRKCLAFTAYAHELLHFVEKDMFDIKNSQHQPPLFNDNMIDPDQSIEIRVAKKAYSEFESCMVDYE